MMKVYSHTMALCAECSEKIQAKIIEKDDKIFMKKFCPEHGVSEVLISSDAEWYRESRFYIKPKQDPLETCVTEFKGCPDSCGSCPEHLQHACLPVIEINNACNLNCPVCLKNLDSSFLLSRDEFKHILDSLIKYEGTPDVVNLSGGEPTLHPFFEEFIEMTVQKGIPVVSVSTNGLPLLEDKKLRDIFKKNGAIAALQFDGFKSSTYQALRGRDLSSEKQELIRILEEEEIPYSLTATIAAGINENEVTAITDFFFQSKALSLMFQPVAFTGSAAAMDVHNKRLTIPDVVREIERSDLVSPGDFNPLPCSHFSCFALSYYISVEDAFVSLKEFLGRDKFLEIIANRSLPGVDQNSYSILKERIYELWSAKDCCISHEKIIERIREVLREMSTTGFTSKNALSMGFDSMKAIYIHHFMDIHNFDFGRLMKCCNPYPQADGRLMPMCAQNVFFQ
ncbi:MAG: radical SAM protein [bacterium]|nr:radical SAM protein [bacterium]